MGDMEMDLSSFISFHNLLLCSRSTVLCSSIFDYWFFRSITSYLSVDQPQWWLSHAQWRVPRKRRVQRFIWTSTKESSEACSESSTGDSDGWEIYSRKKRTRRSEKDNSLNEAVEAAVSMIKMDAGERLSFFTQKIGKACCSRCSAKGEWIRGKRSPKTKTWIWGCGTLTGRSGCGRVVPRSFSLERHW